MAFKQELLLRWEEKHQIEEQKVKEFKRENLRLKKELEGKSHESNFEVKKLNDEYQKKILMLEREKEILEKDKSKSGDANNQQLIKLKEKMA